MVGGMVNLTDDVRESLLAAAESLLVESADGEISTRAVCDAVGVTQPVLYRIFRDKQGLLDALAEVGLRRYAARKQDLERTDDPVADLRAGWVDHVAFALGNPAVYRLMFSPRPGVDVQARDGVLALLKVALRRCAAAGVLRRDVDDSAAMILSANVGLAMNCITQPEAYGSPGLSEALRDAVFDDILTATAPRQADAPLVSAARQLAAHVEMDAPSSLIPEERDLLLVWLGRLVD